MPLHLHLHAGHDVSLAGALQPGHALAANAKNAAALRAGGNLQAHRTRKGRHANFSAQRRHGERNRHLAMQVHSVALKNGMLL